MADNIETEVNGILLKNRNILQWHYDAGKRMVSKVELVEQGFLFEYHTQEMNHQDANLRFEFCYEYGIGALNDSSFVLVKIPV